MCGDGSGNGRRLIKAASCVKKVRGSHFVGFRLCPWARVTVSPLSVFVLGASITSLFYVRFLYVVRELGRLATMYITNPRLWALLFLIRWSNNYARIRYLYLQGFLAEQGGLSARGRTRLPPEVP